MSRRQASSRRSAPSGAARSRALTIRCEVAIVGGGPAGATAARLLAAWGHEVVLVEAAAAPRDKVGEILAPSARPILEALALAAMLDADPALARHCLGVASDWGGSHVRDYLREPGGHGWIIDRRRFEAALAREAVAAGVDWRWGHRLKRAASSRRLVVSAPSGGGRNEVEIEADFAIDASGRSATLGRRLGGRRRVATQLIAREAPAPATPDTSTVGGPAWVRIAAVPSGWRYEAEGPDGRRRCFAIGREPDPPGRAGKAWETGFAILDRLHGDGWVAIGDAAASFDPVTSQGIPNALASGLAAAHAVHAVLDGEAGQLDGFAEAMRATWDRSLNAARSVYASETRWKAEPFWASEAAI
jgi:flavin-dependent dehydrogenase